VLGVLTDKDAFSPILNSAEVEEIFDVPLEMFLKVCSTVFVLLYTYFSGLKFWGTF